jgi:hypothetical protein
VNEGEQAFTAPDIDGPERTGIVRLTKRRLAVRD